MRVILPKGLFLLPYVPLGLLLLVMRAVIFPHALLASSLLSSCGAMKRFVLRVMCFVLGWMVWIKHERKSPRDRKYLPIVSNHVTLFDHLMICLLQECITPHQHVLHWYSTFMDIKDDPVSELIGQTMQKGTKPVLLFPERSPTNSPDHLLMFDPTMFESVEKVQPLALKVYRPFPIKLVEYPLIWYQELLWHFFVPFTLYQFEYLDPMSRLPDESAADFADRVRAEIARALNVLRSDINSDQLDNRPQRGHESESSTISQSSGASTVLSSPRSSISTMRSSSISSAQTVLSSTDGLRFRNSLAESPPTRRSQLESIANTNRPEAFDHLVPVVRNVLHHASVNKIRKALVAADGDVDAAIDALVTVSDDFPSNQEVEAENSLTPVSRLNMAAETFHTNSKARQTSLDERRQKLLAHAREIFLATSADHG
ncbi:Ancient ubiquitous protein 1 [Paragonimus westermani]|uniref:Ancient ubiquitous protein 1 n=1 Tax=Paragonimus westermani TaxID=34504 RepID=A0A8T0DQL3_9TREM|nr:Ancient ubiquitous protein 1 [Paragonimus westermani]